MKSLISNPTLWKKIPSVTREGRFFFRSNSGALVIQSFLTGEWLNSEKPDQSFKTSKAAMKASD